MIVLGQLIDSTNIELLSAFGQASELKSLDHSLSQFGHSYTSRFEFG